MHFCQPLNQTAYTLSWVCYLEHTHTQNKSIQHCNRLQCRSCRSYVTKLHWIHSIVFDRRPSHFVLHSVTQVPDCPTHTHHSCTLREVIRSRRKKIISTFNAANTLFLCMLLIRGHKSYRLITVATSPIRPLLGWRVALINNLLKSVGSMQIYSLCPLSDAIMRIT